MHVCMWGGGGFTGEGDKDHGEVPGDGAHPPQSKGTENGGTCRFTRRKFTTISFVNFKRLMVYSNCVTPRPMKRPMKMDCFKLCLGAQRRTQTEIPTGF